MLKNILRQLAHWLMKISKIPAARDSSDEEFLDEVYQKFLKREIDAVGRDNYLKHLEAGRTRIDIIRDIVNSEEFVNKIIRDHIRLPSIKVEKPDQYQLAHDIYANQDIWVFKVKEMEDFDWLEKKIRENGYYEQPGVWSLQINEDKQLLADFISIFRPEKTLEIGCANGPLMKCLKDRGLYSEGIDISKSAIAKAYPEIRENIHLGDLLEISLPSSYDMVLGMDIFEHYNPNKLKDYISETYNLLDDGGYLFCNIPAFEKDPVFGEVFKKYIKEWEEDSLKNRCFRTVHVDDEGYPKNGHLIGASSTWWVEQFESAGFKREIEIEIIAHKKYDEAMKRILIARTTFYIFSKNPHPGKNSEIIEEFERR